MEKYIKNAQLGEGQFGVVYLASESSTTRRARAPVVETLFVCLITQTTLSRKTRLGAADRRTNTQVALKKIRLGADRLKEGVHFTALRESIVCLCCWFFFFVFRVFV